VTGVVFQTLEGHLSIIKSVAFSSDSKQVVSGFYDKTVRIWNVMTEAVFQILKDHSS
jgi:WD40 repeat protein